MWKIIKDNVLEIVSILIAVSALIFTGLQYRLAQEHNKMTVLPIMLFEYTKPSILIRNDGLGPSIITGIDIYYDNKMDNVTDFNSIAYPISYVIQKNKIDLKPKDYQIKHFSSFVVVKSDNSFEILKLKNFSKSKEFQKLLEVIDFGVCYKSVYNDRFYITSIDTETPDNSCNYKDAYKIGGKFVRKVDPMEKIIQFSDIVGE